MFVRFPTMFVRIIPQSVAWNLLMESFESGWCSLIQDLVHTLLEVLADLAWEKRNFMYVGEVDLIIIVLLHDKMKDFAKLLFVLLYILCGYKWVMLRRVDRLHIRIILKILKKLVDFMISFLRVSRFTCIFL